MKKERPITLIELCVDRAGFRRGAKVMAFVVAWGRVRDDLGHTPTVEQYAAWWKQPIRSAYEEQEKFRVAFPELSTPDPLLDAMRSSSPTGAIDTAALAAA